MSGGQGGFFALFYRKNVSPDLNIDHKEKSREMEYLLKAVDILIHLDKYLQVIISEYGLWVYLILFLIIFCETGFVVTPFLPGDSLLFAAGAFAAIGQLNIIWLIFLLFLAAFLGDTVNYWIGHYVGDRVFESRSRFIKKEYLDRTQKFYEKHGGKTIFLARFIPIIRTFAPFVAGIGTMRYGRFLMFNVVGGLVGVISFSLFGYYLGNLSFFRNNFSLIVIIIILISTVPIAYEIIRSRFQNNSKQA
jgi:membrane-associated protein